MRRVFLACSALAAAGASPLFAQASAPPQTAPGDVAVTIYNDNLALVQDKRQLMIPAGRSRQEFRDVSGQIRAETVSFGTPDTAIVEQNFDYDPRCRRTAAPSSHTRFGRWPRPGESQDQEAED